MKVFTMVKGELDIVKDWILYHGKIFGFKNLFVIDNYSMDGTYQELLHLKSLYNINVTRMPDYLKKGEYMTSLLRQFGKGEIVFPIDIDEFIVFYNKGEKTISCDRNLITQHIESLPPLPFYKMNYINAKNFNPVGYKRATIECNYGSYSDLKGQAKTFFHSGLFKGVIDHGNHYFLNNYLLSNLCLVHFHQRNLEQIKKKVFNNVKGLGYEPFNLKMLKQLQSKGTSVNGFHHVDKQIKILENRFRLDVETRDNKDISLIPFNETILALDF